MEYISVLNDKGEITDVKYDGIVRRGENKEDYDKTAKKYLDYYKKHGFYKININSKEWKDFIKGNLELVESFDNKIIDTILSYDYSSGIDNSVGLLKTGTLNGFYTLRSKKDFRGANKGEFPTIDDYEIIVSKMFLIKNKYEELINFIHSDFLLKENDTPTEKDNNKFMLDTLLDTFKTINNKQHPEIIFSNLIGTLIKLSILRTLNKRIDSLKKNNSNATQINKIKNKFIQNMIKDLVNVVQDEKCYIKNSDMGFLKIEPKLCKFDNKSISSRNLSRCKIEKDSISKELKSTKNQLEKTNSSRKLWLYIASAFIFLFIIFLILYIFKKCPKPENEE